MTQLKTIQEKPINLFQLRNLLEQIKEKQKELNFRAEKTINYAQQITDLEYKKANEVYNKLINLKINRLKELHIQTLINLMPKTEDEVKLILQGYNLTLTKEAIEQILKVFEEYAIKK